MSGHLQTLRRRLAGVRQEDPPPGVVHAAVLVPFVEHDGEWSLVLTRRSDSLSSHSGEISFPGGRVDPGEKALDAALREAMEELGIPPAAVEVIGPLPSTYIVVSGYAISPWVGAVSSPEFHPNPNEIAEVLLVPLDVLLDPSARREQRFIRAGVLSTNPAYDVGANTIWGATARILTDLLAMVGGNGPT